MPEHADSAASSPHNPSTSDAASTAPSGQPTNPDYLLAPPNAGTSGPVAGDPDHVQNELMGPDRGEFGRHASGATHGGYGGVQPGREEGGAYSGPLGAVPATTGYDGERAQTSAGFADNSNGSFGSQPEQAPTNSTVSPTYANDNAAPKGPDSGFAADYGTTSLGGSTSAGQAAPAAAQRNQTEDYRPGHPEQGPQGLTTGAAPTNTAQGRNEADTTPSNPGQRSGYQAAGSPDSQGSQQTGFGSRGGSYNDEYDAASDAGAQGSPSRGDYDQQGAAQNYGGAAADRTDSPDTPDYGPAPTRQ